jgi:hypothetical protein
MTQYEVQRAAGDPWPNRCAQHAYALREALVDSSKAQPNTKDLAYWAEKLAVQLKDDNSYANDLSASMDEAWTQAKKLGLVATQVPEIPAAPAPAAPLTVDLLAASDPVVKGAANLKSLHTEPHAGASLQVLFDDKEAPNSPLLCTFTASHAHCAQLSGDVASQDGLRLLGSSDDESDVLVFAGTRGASGVFRSQTGEKVESGGFSGYAAKDGFSSVLVWDEASKDIRLTRKNGKDSRKQSIGVPESRLKMVSPYAGAQLMWNHLVVRGANRFGEQWLSVADVQSAEPGLTALQDVGSLAEPGGAEGKPDDIPPLTGCRTPKTTVIRARGEKSEFLSFLINGKWTKPVTVLGTGGTLSCRRSEASIARVDQPPGGENRLETAITHARCTAASCQIERMKLDQFLKGELTLAPTATVAAADVDGKLLVVWDAGERGGLRMRLAPSDRIAKAPDVIIFDDLVKEGVVQKASTIFDVRLYSREKFAVLMLATSAGLYTIRVDSDGKFAPIKVESSAD